MTSVVVVGDSKGDFDTVMALIRRLGGCFPKAQPQA